MANNTKFEMTGRLTLGKETDKFKPYTRELAKNNKNWRTTSLKCNAVCGSNKHFLEIKGGSNVDGTSKIYSYSKPEVKGGKGKSMIVAYKDRFDIETLKSVAEFKKFVVDLEEPNRRFLLKKAIEKMEDGSVTPEDLEKVGLKNESELKGALIDSEALRTEFLLEEDFADCLHNIIKGGEYANRMFNITGEEVYSEYNGKIYTSLVPQRVYLADISATPKSEATYVICLNQESVVEMEDSERTVINGFVRAYNKNDKEHDLPVPVQLVADYSTGEELDKKKMKRIIEKKVTPTVSDKWYEVGLKVDMINGSQKVEITLDMLDDEQREDIELGLYTLEQIIAEMGGNTYGDKVKELRIKELGYGYSKGIQETIYEDSDFVLGSLESVDMEDTNDDLDLEDDYFGEGLDDDLEI